MAASFDISLYFVLDPEHAGGRDLSDLAAAGARGGAGLFQLRDKRGGARESVLEARRLVETLNAFGKPLLIRFSHLPFHYRNRSRRHITH